MNGYGRDEKKENKEKSRASVMTRETVGMTLLLFSAVIFFILVTGPYLFGEIGVAITAFFLGIFGFMAYPLLVYTVYQSVVLVFGKGRISWGWKLRVGFLLVSAFFIAHTATAESFFGNGFGAYMTGCWNAARESAADGTGGGVLLGLIVYPVRALLAVEGAYVVFIALALLSVFLIILKTPLGKKMGGIRFARRRREERKKFDPQERFEEPRSETRAVAFEDLAPPVHRMPSSEAVRPRNHPANASFGIAQDSTRRSSEKDRSKEILFGADPQESYRNNLIFSHDSYFNSRSRSSSMYRNLSEDSAKNTLKEAPEAYYSAHYSSAAERTANPVPRRVSEEKPVSPNGYTYSPANDISYSQTPSYRAEPPKPVMPEKRDYYGHDVPYNENFSTEPSAPAAEQKPLPSFASEPVANETASRAAVSEEPTPAEDIFSRMSRARREESAPQEEIDYNSGDSIRSLFSRSVGEDRTQFPREALEPEENLRASRTERAFSDEGIADTMRGEDRSFSREEEEFSRGERRSAASLFDDDAEDDFSAEEEVPPPPTRVRAFAPREREARIAPPSAEAAPAPAPKRHIYRQYAAPDYSLFRDYNDAVMVSQEEIERNSAVIEEALAGFRIDAKVVKVTCGATVTRYDLEIPGNVSVNTVVKRDQEIAMRLHASDGVNVYANRANGTVSVDVPNSAPATVGLRPLLYANEYVNSKPGSLMFVIGKDVEGKPVIGNIVKMKQLLVAGTTGSGKSVCLHSMLISLICKYSPEDLRLILIDPKGEFTIYEGLPHLMINEIISDAQKAVTSLNWAIKEMERRYALFQQKTRSGVLARNIDEYNSSLTEDEQKLCKIVIVVDELADLMSVAKKDIEERIQRLTQKSRAAGIHLVISTQRPSVDVITGVIKGNLPTRMALRVIQEVDSRTIIDETGAQKLLGNGDMLFRTEGMFNCMRVQGAFLSSKEVEQVVKYVKENNEAYFDTEVSDYINNPGQAAGASAGDGDDDGGEVNEQYIKALKMVVKLGSASISLIQRKCSVGYNHAGKIMEWMELMGYVSPFDGKAKARTVLLTKEECESKYGSLD